MDDRKKSRKEILIPRRISSDYDDDENIAEMQKEVEDILTQMTFKKRKIATQPYKPSIDFSVKVEVEPVNEPDIEEIDDDEPPPNTEVDTELPNTEVIELDSDDDTQNNVSVDIVKDNELHNIRANETHQVQLQEHYILSDEIIINYIDKLSSISSNPVDKFVGILAKNYYNKPTSIEKSPLDQALQDVLVKWRNLTPTAENKFNTPLFYKCLACVKAWWHFYDFREHMIKHTNKMKFKLEDNTIYERNIVAYENVYEKINIHIDSNCVKCERPVDHHYLIHKSLYKCICGAMAYTCMHLNVHQAVCHHYQKIKQNVSALNMCELPYKCYLCSKKFSESDSLLTHMSYCHTVRSDVPAIWPRKMCKECNLPFDQYYLHDCPRRKAKTCQYCERKFSFMKLLEIHWHFVRKKTPCRICKKILKKQCIELNHLLEHTDSYLVLYKCSSCVTDKCFSSVTSVRHHATTHSKRIPFKIDVVYVPKICIKDYNDKIKLKERENVMKEFSGISENNFSPIPVTDTDSESVSSPTQVERTELEECVSSLVKVMGNNDDNFFQSIEKNIHEEFTSTQIPDDNEPEGNISSLNQEDLLAAELEESVSSLVKVLGNSSEDRNMISSSEQGLMSNETEERISSPMQDDMEIAELEESVSSLVKGMSTTLVERNMFSPLARDLQNDNSDENVPSTVLLETQGKVSPPVQIFENTEVKDTPERVLLQDNNTEESVPSKVLLEAKDRISAPIQIVQSTEFEGAPESMVLENVSTEETVESNRIESSDIISESKALTRSILGNQSLLCEIKITDVRSKAYVDDKYEKKLDTVTSKVPDVDIKQEKEDYNDLYAEIKEELIDIEYNDNINSSCNPENVKTKTEITEESQEEIYEDDIIMLNADNFYSIDTNDLAALQSVNEFINNEAVLTNNEKSAMSNDDSRDFTKDNTKNEDGNDDNESSDSYDDMTLDKIKRKRMLSKKSYTCRKCGFTGIHWEFRIHMESCEAPLVYQRKRTVLSKKINPNIRFHCTKCNCGFYGMKKYLSHFTSHGYLPLECPQCNKTLKADHHLMAHVHSHIKVSFISVRAIDENRQKFKMGFQCKKCKVFVKQKDFFDHWENHLELKIMNCDGLNKNDIEKLSPNIKWIIETITSTDGHMNERPCKTKLRNCKFCNRSFDRRNDCKRHYIEHLLEDAYSNLTKTANLRCQICGEGFQKSDIYRTHMRFHASLPIYKCELCNKCFSDSSNFAKHKKVHNMGCLICDICKKKFNTKFFLMSHLKMHDVTKPIPCKYFCKKVFFSASAHNKHCKVFHERAIKFRCKVCKMSFPSLKKKWDHMWEVHQLRAQLADCPICGEKFRKFLDVKNHLQNVHDLRHMKIYSAEIYRPLPAPKTQTESKEYAINNAPVEEEPQVEEVDEPVQVKEEILDPEDLLAASYIRTRQVPNNSVSKS